MKKIIFSLIILVGASSAYADANLAMEDNLYEKYADESKSHYQTLGDLFKSGSAPDIKKLVGVAWAGRCFRKKQPDIPKNGVYIVRVAKKLDVGPIGKGKETYKASSYWTPKAAPNYYDNMTLDEVNKQFVKIDYDRLFGSDYDFNKFEFGNNSIAIEEDSIVIEYSRGNISKLRISGEYLINEVSLKIGEDVGPIKKSTYETQTRCYYFISKYRKK